MTPDVLKALRVPGQLILNPTNLATARPHGGLSMGLIKDVKWRRVPRYFEIEAEEFGGEVVEQIWQGESWLLVFALRSTDVDAISAAFPNSNLSTTTGKRRVTAPGTIREGIGLTTTPIKLLFSPDDAKNHECVYFRAAAPVSEPMEVSLGREEESLMLVSFKGFRDATTPSASVQRGLIEDIVL